LTPDPTLSPALASAVLAYLKVTPAAPDIAFLDALVTAYTRTVPWESVSRIARRARVSGAAECPRWPDEFWHEAMQHGTGGTCFESNYAFFSLLCALGYDGYLTINNMGQTVGCHTAIIVTLDRQRWLTDVGLPVYVPLPMDRDKPTQRTSAFYTYIVRPLDGQHYQIERSPHPKPVCFTLVDVPIDEVNYRAATTGDYDPESGLFLQEIIVNKVIDGDLWRFSSHERPYRLEHFRDGVRADTPVDGDVAGLIAQKFGVDVETIRAALAALKL
jgi:arylamine N-acetyltransferase